MELNDHWPSLIHSFNILVGRSGREFICAARLLGIIRLTRPSASADSRAVRVQIHLNVVVSVVDSLDELEVVNTLQLSDQVSDANPSTAILAEKYALLLTDLPGANVGALESLMSHLADGLLHSSIVRQLLRLLNLTALSTKRDLLPYFLPCDVDDLLHDDQDAGEDVDAIDANKDDSNADTCGLVLDHLGQEEHHDGAGEPDDELVPDDDSVLFSFT